MLFDEKYTEAGYIRSNDERPLVVVEENKRKYYGKNTERQRVVVYRVDGGVIKSEDVRKCDFAIYASASRSVYLVELKGSNFSDAVEQIVSTIEELLAPGLDLKAVYARIVLSKVANPNIRSSNKLTLDRLLRKWNGNLLYKEKLLTESLR